MLPLAQVSTKRRVPTPEGKTRILVRMEEYERIKDTYKAGEHGETLEQPYNLNRKLIRLIIPLILSQSSSRFSPLPRLPL